MQNHDARILRGAIIPTVLAGVPAIVAGAVLVGVKGAIGAAIGLAVVVAFFSIGLLAVTFAARISPMMMMQAAIFSYLVKVIALIGLVTVLEGVTIWHPPTFALTAIGLTVVWVAAEARGFLKLKVIHLDGPATAAPVPGRGPTDRTPEREGNAAADSAGKTETESPARSGAEATPDSVEDRAATGGRSV